MKLGQHFMIDGKVLRRVVDCAELEKSDAVLEVGPGKGALTKKLMAKSKVVAIEKDEELVESLKKEIPEVDIVSGDAMKMAWPPFDKCVSNLPYLISKPFILKLLQHEFELSILVLQKEFAEKLAAVPGSRNYGTVSVCAQLCCRVELLDKIPRNAFKPQPKVESRIVRLRQNRVLDQGLREFITKLFQRRNKKSGEKRVFQMSPEEIKELYDGTDRD
jgi:16S rRNA (adenine1518-N6/adenine1519-N6)-dimethyltransferase